VTACRSCEAEIAWAYTEGGSRMPLDADQVPDGNVVALPNGRVRVLKAGEEPPPGAARYRSHFVTCPHASTHRKPASPAEPTLF
jgi:hypothetical protein